MWMKQASVGSFVVMRHSGWKMKTENKLVPCMFGVITKKIIPRMRKRDLRVRWQIRAQVYVCGWLVKMGFKTDLSKATMSYITAKFASLQCSKLATCNNFDKIYQGVATAASVRRDLWQNGNDFVLPVDENQSVRKTCLVTRTRLACLTVERWTNTNLETLSTLAHLCYLLRRCCDSNEKWESSPHMHQRGNE